MNYTHLYGLTIQGIQNYIFETNKLKEIIGASELIEELCTETFQDYITRKKIEGELYLNAAGNIRFATTEPNALVLIKDFGCLINLMAPGLPFSQALSEIKDDDLDTARTTLENSLRAQRNKNYNHVALGTMMRSTQRRVGGFAAKKPNTAHDDTFLDDITHAKFSKWEGKTLQNKIEISAEDYVLPTEFKQISDGGKHSWLALIHIDGNGMGKIINDLLKQKDLENKFEMLKEFSANINTATTAAFNTAIEKVFIKDIESKKVKKGEDEKWILPFRPLVLGGDDVTVIMRSDFALEFVKVYLTSFEAETEKIKILEKELTACAGIAYVKEKFPFHYSTHLAEELCKYAKVASKREASCVQVHQVTDTIIEDYEEIIGRTLNEFKPRPFYLEAKKESATNTENDACSKITIEKIITNTKLLSQEDSPKNALREWINAKFNHPLMADELWRRIEKKTKNKDYKHFLKEDEKNRSLVYQSLLDVQ